MSPDEVVLLVQRLIDRLVRRLRLGSAPRQNRRRLLIVQIDGLSRAVLARGLATGRIPFLGHLLRRHGFRAMPMTAGMPTSTPAFQLALMYGVRPDIPGFHYHDKRRRADIYFPRAGDAAFVETEQAGGRAGILRDGSAYGCVFGGGARNTLFSFTTITRPRGAGVMQIISAFVVLGWVMVKSTLLSAIELTRAGLRFVADPVGESTRGWKWLGFKLGVSVWVRELFTLAASRDLYRGVPAVYVNYLDYDVFAHAYGPRHPRAMASLRRIDRSIHQLWRVVRRLPECGYDLYVLSDHGQVECVPYQELSGGIPFARRLFDDLGQAGAAETAGSLPSSDTRLRNGLSAFRSRRTPGLLQRFVNHLEDGVPWLVGQLPRAYERGGVRVVVAGPNAFVYFVDSPEPLTVEEIDRRFPGLADDLSRSRGVGFVLARSGAGPVCLWQGKRHVLDRDEPGPFAGREDAGLVVQGIRDLVGMPSAGDLIVYGNGSPDGNVSYLREVGAHAGPSREEIETFVVVPPGVSVPSPITHPRELYAHFIAYDEQQGEDRRR